MGPIDGAHLQRLCTPIRPAGRLIRAPGLRHWTLARSRDHPPSRQSGRTLETRRLRECAQLREQARLTVQKPSAVLISGTWANSEIAGQFTTMTPRPHASAAPRNTIRPGRDGGKSSLGLRQGSDLVMKISHRGLPAQSPNTKAPARGHRRLTISYRDAGQKMARYFAEIARPLS